MKNGNRLLRMILASLFLALAYTLPFLTGQIPKIGSMLCLMHLPILLCGFICGWYWGLAIGVIAPLLRSLTLGAPILYPMAVCMAVELAVYGVVAGIMYRLLPRKKPFIYCSLLTAMLAGRLAWGASMFLCLAIKGGRFTFGAFLSGAFVNALPGIILQIALVPLIVMLAEHTGTLKN